MQQIGMTEFDNKHQQSGGLLVLLTSGHEDGGKRATLAYTAACTSAAMGKRTQIFLACDGSFWGYRGREEGIMVTGFPPLEELMESFCELGGKVYICSACDGVCAVQCGEEEQDLVRHAWVQPRGMAAVLDMLEGGNSLTF
jgi:predicted peroxiredoxin